MAITSRPVNCQAEKVNRVITALSLTISLGLSPAAFCADGEVTINSAVQQMQDDSAKAADDYRESLKRESAEDREYKRQQEQDKDDKKD